MAAIVAPVRCVVARNIFSATRNLSPARGESQSRIVPTRSHTMSTARKLLRTFAFAFAFSALPAFAGMERPFDAAAFTAAQDAGKPVLVEIHADWCPTCKAQKPVLDRLSGQPKYSGVERFRVDFDAQKDLVKRFKAKTQSTLVMYRGKDEVARSVGETDESRIRALLDKAL
jgi:thioredoxin 1